MNITAEKKRLQTKLDAVNSKLDKEKVKLVNANLASQKATIAIHPLENTKACLESQIAVLEEHAPLQKTA